MRSWQRMIRNARRGRPALVGATGRPDLGRSARYGSVLRGRHGPGQAGPARGMDAVTTRRLAVDPFVRGDLATGGRPVRHRPGLRRLRRAIGRANRSIRTDRAEGGGCRVAGAEWREPGRPDPSRRQNRKPAEAGFCFGKRLSTNANTLMESHHVLCTSLMLSGPPGAVLLPRDCRACVHPVRRTRPPRCGLRTRPRASPAGLPRRRPGPRSRRPGRPRPRARPRNRVNPGAHTRGNYANVHRGGQSVVPQADGHDAGGATSASSRYCGRRWGSTITGQARSPPGNAYRPHRMCAGRQS